MCLGQPRLFLGSWGHGLGPAVEFGSEAWMHHPWVPGGHPWNTSWGAGQAPLGRGRGVGQAALGQEQGLTSLLFS